MAATITYQQALDALIAAALAQRPDLAPIIERARPIADDAMRHIFPAHLDRPAYQVESAARDAWYLVDYDARTCTCPQSTHRREAGPCKHWWAVRLYAAGHYFRERCQKALDYGEPLPDHLLGRLAERLAAA